MNSKEFYVYIWYDPTTNQPFYVGKGKGKRAYAVGDKSRNEHFMRKYRKLESTGNKPYVRIEHENLLESDALQIELNLIKKYRPAFEGGPLTNQTYGSGGTSNISPYTSDLLSKISSGENNGMSKFTESNIRDCFNHIVNGLSNKEVFNLTGVPSHIVSDLRYGKKWKSIYDEYKDSINDIKISGLNKHNFSFETKIKIINELYNRDNKTLLKDIAEKYKVKTSFIISINIKRQWKSEWEIYLSDKS